MASSTATRAEQALEIVLADRRVAWVAAALFAAAGLASVATDRYLHKEGILTWVFSAWQLEDFLPAFFLTETRPVLSLLYAPAAAGGSTLYFCVKVLACSLTIPMVAAIAQSAGQRRPNLPALITGLSPLLLAAASAGVSNADAAFGAVLLLWLLQCAERPGAAGVVGGALLLVRAELLLLLLLVAAYAVFARKRPRRFLLGACAVPLAYGIAGMIYHGDPLWFVHYAPWLSGLDQASSTAGSGQGEYVQNLVNGLISVTPLVLLLAFVRPRSLAPVERLAGAFFVVFLLFIRGAPLLQLFDFDDSPRFLLPGLPFAALVLGRVFEGFEPRDNRRWAPALALVCLALAAHFFETEVGDKALLWVALITAVTVALAQLSRPRWAVTFAVVAGLVAAVPFEGRTGLLFEGRESMQKVAAWLAEQEQSAPVATDIPVLRLYLDHRGMGNRDVAYLPAPGELQRFDALTNEAVGQRAAVRALMDDLFYGRPARFDGEESLEPGTWVVLAVDPSGAAVAQGYDRRELQEHAWHHPYVIAHIVRAP